MHRLHNQQPAHQRTGKAGTWALPTTYRLLYVAEDVKSSLEALASLGGPHQDNQHVKRAILAASTALVMYSSVRAPCEHLLIAFMLHHAFNTTTLTFKTVGAYQLACGALTWCARVFFAMQALSLEDRNTSSEILPAHLASFQSGHKAYFTSTCSGPISELFAQQGFCKRQAKLLQPLGTVAL